MNARTFFAAALALIWAAPAVADEPADEPGYTPGASMPGVAMPSTGVATPLPDVTPAIPGSGPGAKSIVYLPKQGVYGVGWRRSDGLWVIDPGSKVAPAVQDRAAARVPLGGSAGPVAAAPSGPPGGPTAATPAVAPSAPPDHRGRFLSWLNGWRAQHGRRPVGYSGDLESWAAANNSQQRLRGMGHHAMGSARRQNAAMSGSMPHEMWAASPGHADALLDASVTTIGLAFDGIYWTLNLR